MQDLSARVFEHIRRIHFFFVVTCIALGYMTLTVTRDRPNYLAEIDALEKLLLQIQGFDTRTASIPISNTPSTTDSETIRPLGFREVVEFIERVNRPQVASLRIELSSSLREHVHATDLGIDLDSLLFPPQAIVVNPVSNADSLSTILRQLEEFQFEVLVRDRVTSPSETALRFPKPPVSADVKASLQPRVVGKDGEINVNVLYYREGVGGGDLKVRVPPSVLGGPFDVPLILVTRRIRIDTDYRQLQDSFPNLRSLAPDLRAHSLPRLRKIAEEDSEKLIRRSSARVFDIEVQGKDLALVLSLMIIGALFYLATFCEQATALANRRHSTNDTESTGYGALWIATHVGWEKHTFEATVIAGVATCCWCAYTVITNELTSPGVIALVLLAGCLTWRSVVRLRHQLRTEA